jgi:hypothetical protein
LAASPYQDSTDDYPKIGESTCWSSVDEDYLITMVAPVGAPSNNNSSQYPTIVRLKVSDARTPDDRLIQNLNSYFNAMYLQIIMESIQCMALEGSPLVSLAQQGVDAANYVIAERSADNPRGEPSVGNRSHDRVKRA